jgi:hypothetical protein
LLQVLSEEIVQRCRFPANHTGRNEHVVYQKGRAKTSCPSSPGPADYYWGDRVEDVLIHYSFTLPFPASRPLQASLSALLADSRLSTSKPCVWARGVQRMASHLISPARKGRADGNYQTGIVSSLRLLGDRQRHE